MIYALDISYSVFLALICFHIIKQGANNVHDWNEEQK